MAEQDNLDVPMIATVGIVSVILTTVTVLFVQAVYFSFWSMELQQKVIEVPTPTSNSRLARNTTPITTG